MLVFAAPWAVAAAPPGASLAGTVVARAARITRRFRAYGQVQPVATTVARAVEAGIVRRLVLPGSRVKVGQVLAMIAGPQAEALLERRRGALRAARSRLLADRRQFAAQLVTRQQLVADRANYDSARSTLQATLRTLTLRSPVAGRVLRVAVADGAQVSAGQRLLTLQSGRLWLRARFYGAAAFLIRPAMAGLFRPISGGPALAVRVATVAPALGADDGEEVLLQAEGAHARGAWRSGQWGTVIVNGATRTLVAVPTRALILDRALWWVLLRTAKGDYRQRVVPGPARGWLTYLERGVSAGEHVVVHNAYLEFHHGIAGRYAPQD